MTERRAERTFWVLPTIGVLIVIAGAGLDAVSGALGGSVFAVGGLFITANLLRVWQAPRHSRIALIVTLAAVCVITGVAGALLLSAWEWIPVAYGVALAVFGLVPVRRDLREAAARAPR